ncbi:hypothetical protein DESC_540009 [Desulfosarcina cetonica]|nr:hypothetical protein DESC_540009 [Desulfosarcina cetonica]
MAYQPLYGVISDNQGYRRSTSSLRGRVDQVGAWINSYYGDVMNVDVKYIECEMPKVSRKGLTPKAYSEKVKAVRSEVESRHKVIVNIDLEASPHFEYTINGLVIPMERIRQLKDLEMKRFELQLDCLKAMRDEGKQEQAMQLATAMISGRRW